MCVFFICIFIYLLKPIHYHNPLILHNEIIIVFSPIATHFYLPRSSTTMNKINIRI